MPGLKTSPWSCKAVLSGGLARRGRNTFDLIPESLNGGQPWRGLAQRQGVTFGAARDERHGRESLQQNSKAPSTILTADLLQSTQINSFRIGIKSSVYIKTVL